MHLLSERQPNNLDQVVSSRWFALTHLLFVIGSGLLWIFKPEIGVLPIITIALIPWVVKILAGSTSFRNEPLDWFILIFLITGWVGYWAAYDKETAWNKVWLIVLTVLLYYALSTQPKENLEWVSLLLYSVGVGVSIYFLLTHDFVALPRKLEVVNRIGLWITGILPRSGWTPIHPNYVAGIAAITTPFIFYPVVKLSKSKTVFSTLFLILIAVGSVIAVFALFMATSRGSFMAIASVFGIWFIWRIFVFKGKKLMVRREGFFPALVLIFLFFVVLFLYLGPANAGSVASGVHYGSGTRGELLARSAYLLLDFPFTGGGLGAFPGLYSHYILGIPNFYLPNSHNLFMDVGIEQGLLGGISILIVFLMSIWLTAKTIEKTNSSTSLVFSWLTLSAVLIAFIHGMVDDYLYNGPGTLLLLSLSGLSMVDKPEGLRFSYPATPRTLSVLTLILMGFLLIKFNNVRSIWKANIGAVQMARTELVDFPTNEWTDSSILPQLKGADMSLRSALQDDSVNRTANYRLGMIAMLRTDFEVASHHLETAYQRYHNHRGVIKNLGYCYVWLGEIEKAHLLLSKIPEARNELNVYNWWWGVQGRSDLADQASMMVSYIESSSIK